MYCELRDNELTKTWRLKRKYYVLSWRYDREGNKLFPLSEISTYLS